MSRYKAYSECRDSGIEWVGDIPNSWKVTPLFSVASTAAEKNDDGAESNVLSLSYGRIIRRDVEDNHGLLPESFNTYQIVDSGDIILRLTDLQNDKRSLRVGIANEKGIITSAYLKLTAKTKFLDRYLYRLLHSYDTTKVFYGMGGGLRQSMRFEDMRRLQMLCPSLQEQEQIANFLDHETAKIDSLIEKQQRLIELLKEKRQAVISHAVTKGLNPNVPMKDSGVEWLGEVPAHWTLCTLRRHANFIDGDRGAEYPNEKDFRAEGVVFLSSKNIVDGMLDLNEVKFISYEKFKALNRGKALDGDLIVKVRGSAGRIGELAKFETKEHEHKTAFINAQMMIIRTCDRLLANYLRLVAQSLYWTEQLFVGAYGTAQQQLSNEVFSNLCMAIPPLNEQSLILEKIEQKVAISNGLLNKSQKAIELMQERRTALISAAVTGRIDVRDWQPAAA